MFGYNSTVICDENNYTLTVDVNTSNMHDSIAFYQTFDKFINKFNNNMPNYFAGDVAYIAPHICKTIVDLNMIPCVPYKRPMTKEGYFKKYEYVDDEENNIYICPDNCDLIPTTINKDGYIIYKADKNDCLTCPFKEQCTKMKVKQVTRHVWEKYKEMANDYRHHIEIL